MKIKKILNLISKEPVKIPHFVKLYILQKKDRIRSKYNYQQWFKKNYPTKKELKIQMEQSKKFKYHPKISIITPVYNPPEKWFKSCLNSVLNQSYKNWELCLADDNSSNNEIRNIIKEYAKKDKRIKFVFRSKNGHISEASNSALKIARGSFIALLDHDDELSPNALFEIVNLINKNSKADLIYSDEDKLELNGKHVDPSFKPDWSPDMFLSTNYLCHLTVIRKSLVSKINGFRKGFEGSQDYDLFLRIIEKTNQIYHIPKVLYHWRKIPNSTASVYSIKNYANQASLNALNDYLKRQKINAQAINGLKEGTFRIKYKIKNNPLVSIIIPTKNNIKYLKKCIDSIISKTTYQNYEILIIDTGSTQKETLDFYKKSNKKIKVFNWEKPFNYSSVNNFSVQKTKGDYLLFLNDDTEIISSDWIESMLEHAQRKEIGAVGSKLLYPNNDIQHAGVILGLGGIANPNFYHISDSVNQPFPMLNSKDMIRNFSAVTGACLMVKKDKFLLVSGFDPKFQIAYNDIDLCLKLNQKGFKAIYTPFAKIFHYESISISKNRNNKQFKREENLMRKKWSKIIKNDPFYNPNLQQ